MKIFRYFALVLAVALLCSLLPLGAMASGELIEIYTPSQLRELSRQCTLDSWSTGKIVVLKQDIDLLGEEFTPIAYFNGSFDGGGHTISGLSITAPGATVGGLFRYIGEEGEVRELTVSGTVAPEVNAEGFGGIAGENRGEIINCTFKGAVSGRKDIGGIVGVNASTGYISGCRSLGIIAGEHYTGGIAGRNMGSIFSCNNLGSVNTTNPEIISEELNIDWAQLNSAENVSVHTDTGGIAGYSEGRLDSCTNRGNVGYPHVGYNVGGVAGRLSGFMDHCRNFGSVNGRKDVGGIVGQLVPSITLQFSSNNLTKLQNEMSILEGLLDDMIGSFESSSSEISGILTNAGAYLKNAGNSAFLLGEALVGFVDGNIENINDFASLAGNYAQRLGTIIAHLEDCFGYLGDATDQLGLLIEAVEKTGEEFSDIMELALYANEKMGGAMDDLSGALGLCRSAAGDIVSFIENMSSGADGENPKNMDELVGEIQNVVDAFTAVAKTAAGKMENALLLVEEAVDKAIDAKDNGIVPILNKLKEEDSGLEEFTQPLAKATENLGLAMDSLEKMAGDMEDWFTDIGRENMNIFDGLGQDFLDETDRMEAAISGLGGEMEKLNKAMDGSVGLISGDLRKINEQFFNVMECFMTLIQGEEGETIYEDMSEEDLYKEVDGKAQNCENRGEVMGDVNVGGIAGTMAIEYDLDPEEDISVAGSVSGSFRYFINAALLNCVNLESVTAKKDDVGGCVGYMDLGIIYGCENYGSILSQSGDYVGGIAGNSAATVRNSYSLCYVSGGDYVGGIAGSVMDISGCRAIIRLSSEGGYLGSIAGAVSGEAKENYFVGSEIGGIDGVSYSKKAEPLSYEEFIKDENMPGEFQSFNLTFVAENITVKSVSFDYGTSLDFNAVPPVPEKVGHVGAWESFDFTKLTFSDTVNAVYTPYDTVVATKETEGKRAKVLLQGAFVPGSVPQLEEQECTLEGSIAAWTVKALGKRQDDYFVRVLAPESKRDLAVFVLEDGQWTQRENETEGSYLVFPAEGDEVSFSIVEMDREIPYVIIIPAAAIILIAAIIIAAKKSRKKAEKEV